MKPLYRFALCVLLGFSCSKATADAQPVTITLNEARSIARQALADGNPKLAIEIATGLLQANRNDPDALMILSAAHAQAGNARASRQAAAKAYRASSDRRLKLQAAQIAARGSLAENRPTLTQIWLRRVAANAKNDADIDRIAADYAQVRAYNPWSFNFGASLHHSSNINNGSDSSVQSIDGLLTSGDLSGDAQALSGTVLRTNTSLSYRLRGDARSRTTLSARLFVQRVDLSDSARALATTSRNRDFGSTYFGLGINHIFAVGKRAGDTAAFGFGLGKSWYGGSHNLDLVHFNASRGWQIRPNTNIGLGFSAVRRDLPGTTLRDYNTYSITTRLSHKRPSGDKVFLSFGVQHGTSDFVNRQSEGLTFKASYDFERKLGPAKVSTSLTLSKQDYDTYLEGIFFLPDGRQDRAAHADLNFFFADYHYAGFAPKVTLRVGKRSSNISRFDSSETSINFAIQSKF